MADGLRDVTSTSTDDCICDLSGGFIGCMWIFLCKLVAVLVGKGRQAGRQAAPTCYMDRSKDHRISLDRSNSFLHPSCPY